MSRLKLLQEQANRTVAKTAECNNSLKDVPSDGLPLTQYFQIHFQHIHENTRLMQDELVQFRHHIADLNLKVEQLTALLIEQQAMLSGKSYPLGQRNGRHSGH
ncbi:MAG: hypothetical protein PHH59_00945 [Methylovulum sp.]|uniref:hypothetical protein n=1 Tax=Methylovulum sp. TaxID=1916980 RepID=UPI00260B06A3|nr:hypothetical protein [Methylovulum sp.]MDD2722574.1 hypothetical protein [Methylovulum sp.]MDD5123102.1 hypothetical protein [Methylovulum sp.]